MNKIYFVFVLFFIGLVSSCENETITANLDSQEEILSLDYTPQTITDIETLFEGTVSILKTENSLLNLTDLDFDYSKSFQVKVNNNNPYEFYYFNDGSGNYDYIYKKENTLLSKSDFDELSNSSTYNQRSAWGQCYKRVKAILTEAIEYDGANQAICDGLNYLGLCDAAVATASAAICTDNVNAGQ